MHQYERISANFKKANAAVQSISDATVLYEL